jgi:hypothetical protein
MAFPTSPRVPDYSYTPTICGKVSSYTHKNAFFPFVKKWYTIIIKAHVCLSKLMLRFLVLPFSGLFSQVMFSFQFAVGLAILPFKLFSYILLGIIVSAIQVRVKQFYVCYFKLH